MNHYRLIGLGLLSVAVSVPALPAALSPDAPARPPPQQSLIDSRPMLRAAERTRVYAQLLQERQRLGELRRGLGDQHGDVKASEKKVTELEARLRELGLIIVVPEGSRRSG